MTGEGPTRPSERIVLLDVLHGLALLGVMVVDFPLFFRPIWAEFNPASLFDRAGADALARALVTLFFQTKSLTLFALLFGASAAILRRRFGEDDDAFVRHYARRMTVLFLLGALQVVFLWFNNILLLLAVLGAAYLPLRDLSPGRKAALAWTLFLAGAAAASAVLAATSPGAVAGGAQSRSYLYHVGVIVGMEDAAYAGGTWAQVTAFRAASGLLLAPPALLMFGLRIYAALLLGSALQERGWFAPEAAARWKPWALWGAALGLPLQLVTVVVERSEAPSPGMVMARWLSLYLGSAALSAAYAGGACLAAAAWPKVLGLLSPAARVGRMCLTNFLAAMAAGSLLAYPYGAGLYGRIGTAKACAAGLLLYAALAALSTVWLAKFRFGPFERLLRLAAYGRGGA